jgi:serine/threonine protein kinase
LQRCKEALQATQWLHTNGYVHRDLKLQNLGIFNGRTILLDHGGSILLKPGGFAEPVPGEGGTISYMAPEKEMRAYDQAIDVWSLGVVMYIARFGHLPFNFSRNPWRPGNESLRDDFNYQYELAIKRLQDADDLKWSDGKCASVSVDIKDTDSSSKDPKT